MRHIETSNPTPLALRGLRNNAITRGGQTLIYDEENRLVEVQEGGEVIGAYVYDGDGNQVQAVVTDGDLTINSIYIGVYYQQTATLDESVTPAVETTEWYKYYYAGKIRLPELFSHHQ